MTGTMSDNPQHNLLTRRRFIAVAAASAGVCKPSLAATDVRHFTWRGIVMGAQAQIQLVHADARLARDVLDQCVQEIERLEDMFSLYRPASALNRLNRDGKLSRPDLSFTELIATALQISRETDGAFDISVQPLWNAYAKHFGTPDADPTGPVQSVIQQTLDLVDYRQIHLSPQRITLAKKGMALTLNGIAQGFATDRISALLKRNDFSNVLVHLGELYGSGTRPDGTPWRAGIAMSDGSGAYQKTVRLRNGALATSGGYGHTFTTDGAHHHLFDPRTGRSASRYRSVSVAAPSATLADAMATAFYIMPLADIHAIVALRADTNATVVNKDGCIIEL